MAVKLQFKKQDFQQRAVESVAGKEGLFKGQTLADSIYTIRHAFSSDLDISAQRLTIPKERILDNLQTIQKKNGLTQSENLDEYKVVHKYKDDDGNEKENKFWNFTVEMETGTGKTFVYTNTILELNQNFGWNKFIIVVPPSTAIREGVLNSLAATKSWFQKEYKEASYEFFGYSGDNAQRVRSFASSTNIQIMVVTRGSFDSASNIMNKGKTKEDFRTPIEFIREVRPVVIIDEPQSVDTQPIGKEAIASLNPCVVLRYSATHKSVYNLAYKLGPVEAHKEGIVKEISVSSIRAHKDFNKPYIKVIDVEHGSGYKAKLEIDWRNSKGIVERKIRSINKTTDLQDLSGGREFYAEYKVSNIDTRLGFEAVHFDNGTVIPLGGSIGNIDERAMKRAQIMRTIELHFDTEQRLKDKGIKVLSLFFIDHVAKYRGKDSEQGDYALWFEECYDFMRSKFPELTMGDAASAHSGYFSQDKKGGYKDTKGDTKDDESTYDLIMKDKERLLSFDTPVRFIFSHSALKEGWDNPNVFQICTLLEPKTEFTRRQKIGRGLRLCVNQDGERIEERSINRLCVISDENFAEFANGLQKNYEEDLGMVFNGVTIQFLGEITTSEEMIQTTLNDNLIAKTIQLNIKTGAIDESGKIVAPERVAIPSEITTDRAEITKIVENIKATEKIDEQTLQLVSVEIKTTVEKKLPPEILPDIQDGFKKSGYLDANNKPTQTMKDALKKGPEALQLIERAEYARQEIYEFLHNEYDTPEVSNADNTDIAIAKPEVIWGEPFQKLWAKISARTTYKIDIEDEMFRWQVLSEIRSDNWSYIDKVKIVYADADVNVSASGIRASQTSEDAMQTVASANRIPDILRAVSEQCNISKRLIFDILDECDKYDELLNNPQVFSEQFTEVINKVKRRMEVTSIIYIPTGSSFDAEEVFDGFEDKPVNTKTNAVKVDNSLYNYVKYDRVKTELRFAERIDKDNNVELFIKLPDNKRYTIPTPYGLYTPDWAVIKRNKYGKNPEIYFVVETKGSSKDEDLREKEKNKILCAKEHYKKLGFEIVEGEPLVEKNSKYVVKEDYSGFALEG